MSYRLFIGNLDARLTEYHLLQMLQRYEGFTKLHFLWHAAGPKRGEPRDYCFVEFATAETANRAVEQLNGKLALGRALRVSIAKEKAEDDGWNRKRPTEEHGLEVPQTLSLDNIANITARILAVEQKLRLMERESELAVDDLAPAYFAPPPVPVEASSSSRHHGDRHHGDRHHERRDHNDRDRRR
ncbi:hypothetical protein CAOG_03502 [Capsaspora owczarzaki ATCC 30864]|uniref:Probable RNA-binding protein 18 n=1 Tax=Capsaspora owczarzaki (strain ATCC 30864) TaxID=595528 RepID=A0A0D2VPW0_CAPO3|nr:hypothetical protein CAOG_03502 [Capsaspora owczarzaki ATCC 30864]KJE92557.1 hypothetical protein CAOG_003502 [Capsaspora owczarzaki ATCC 30864]|eukprot:XP_004348407.1 hypothetical protein CAOG_03502 [Capsaspora owczarzaki ATCC 30864]